MRKRERQERQIRRRKTLRKASWAKKRRWFRSAGAGFAESSIILLGFGSIRSHQYASCSIQILLPWCVLFPRHGEQIADFDFCR